MAEMKLLHTALLLFPIAIVPISLIVLLWMGIPFSSDPGDMLTAPLFLLISALTIIGFFINFGIVLPRAKENPGALASVLVWPANFIVSGISLAYFSWNMLAFHLLVIPMLLAAAYNYYYFFRHRNP
jgi:O-antigen/teichoic acid export membrane protein